MNNKPQCPPCHGHCNQERDCPYSPGTPVDDEMDNSVAWLAIGLFCFVAAVVFCWVRFFGPGGGMSGSFMPVKVGQGAVMFIQDPTQDPNLCRRLVYPEFYGVDDKTRLAASAVIESFDYLLSSDVSMTEATRRLRVMRAERRAAITKATAQEGKTA